MIMLIGIGIAATVVGVVLVATALARTAPRRENRLAAWGEHGVVPWIDAGGGSSSDCDAGTSSDAGCGDGGGGGGGECF